LYKNRRNNLRLERGFDEVAIVIPCEIENGRYRIWTENFVPKGISETAIPDRAIDGTPIIID
jgi:hypothetical protein